MILQISQMVKGGTEKSKGLQSGPRAQPRSSIPSQVTMQPGDTLIDPADVFRIWYHFVPKLKNTHCFEAYMNSFEICHMYTDSQMWLCVGITWGVLKASNVQHCDVVGMEYALGTGTCKIYQGGSNMQSRL